MASVATYQRWVILVSVASLLVAIVSAGLKFKWRVSTDKHLTVTTLVLLLGLGVSIALATLCDDAVAEAAVAGLLLFISFLLPRGGDGDVRFFYSSFFILISTLGSIADRCRVI